jgi:hypothetical protein
MFVVLLQGVALAETLDGDLDGDCMVDVNDLGLFTAQWLDNPGGSADLVPNGTVDLADFAVLAENWQEQISPIVINEIHHNSDVETELIEFVELYNIASVEVNISGWHFCDGIVYEFPPGTAISAHSYIVVTEDPNLSYNPVTLGSKFGTASNLIYGPFEGNLNSDGEKIELCNADGDEMDQVDYQLGFPWPTVGDSVPFVKPPDGSGHSIQLTNPGFDNDLGGSWRSAYPTPGAENSAVFAANIPPHIRQVNHSPEQPRPGETVTITCKVTDPNGVAAVTLQYQIVEPGSYVRYQYTIYDNATLYLDPAYETGWVTIAMHDDGTGGDQTTGDDIYTVELSGAVQVHRRLIRYRITVEDTAAESVRVPYPDDMQPNFAYFVYDGVPAWSGADQPGVTPIVDYGTEVMRSLPVYHLLTKEQDVLNSQNLSGSTVSAYWGSDYLWTGTLVYDGKVYDNVRYRVRGGGHRYDSGKNMWKFDFNRGHYFQLRDDHGKKYDTKRDKLNLSSTAQNPDYDIHGKQGMFEAVGYKLFNLVGVPGPKTNWIQFRIIDGAAESGPTQYDGDFWGLYLAIEQMDGRFLEEHFLPDGNLYKMEGGTGELNNQGPTQPDDKSDLNAFIGGSPPTYRDGYKDSPTTSWWLANVDVLGYYGYRTVVDGIHHYDIGSNKNYFYYHNPETDIWSVLPWDLDLIFDDDMWDCGNNGLSPFKRYGLWDDVNLRITRNNRIREIRDLLLNTDQAFKLIDDFACVINDPNGVPSIVDADVALWNYHPYKDDPGIYYITINYTGSFEGVIQKMKNYIVQRCTIGDPNEGSKEPSLDAMAYDADIPDVPTIMYIGSNPNYPANDLVFQTSAFSDPQGSGTFAAFKWRAGEITDVNSPAYDPTDAGKYEIEPLWESAEITNPAVTTATVPASVVKPGHTYRVRCRAKDNTGRWSHWSDADEFTAGEPLSAGVFANLRITELMYNPAAGGSYDNEEYEFIELKNTGPNTLDLTYVSFTDGVTFDFNDSNVTSLAPGGFVLVVANQSAFESRYGTGQSSKIAGNYIGSLANGGENVTLQDYYNGIIADFEYGDGRGWPPAADGAGHSLVPLDSAIPPEPEGTLKYGGNWRMSTYMHGSPGAENPAAIESVLINEFMAHTDYNLPPYDSNDWIELYNPTASTVSLSSDWYLSDDRDDLTKWAIPSTLITAGSFVSFDEVSGFHNPITSGFGLDKGGEQIFLSYLPGNSSDRVVDCIRFKGQENDVSLGCYPNGGDYWFVMPPSRNLTNNYPHQPAVVINEIIYHPIGPKPEYVELYNPTGSTVNLYNATGTWRLRGIGGDDYYFPASSSIASYDVILVVGFDPYDSVLLNQFISAYGTGSLTPGTDIFGPWDGNLSNASERIALEKPQAPDNLGETPSWVIVDEVIYADYQPFDETADGTGDSLHRVSAAANASGNDPLNWTANTPSPSAP